MSSKKTSGDGRQGPWANADLGSKAERELPAQLRAYGRENGISPDEVIHRLKSRGVEGLKVNRLHQIAQGKFKTPPYTLLLEWADVLKVDPVEFPALFKIRVRVALNADELEAAEYHIKALRRARRRAEPGGPGTVDEATDLQPPSAEPKRTPKRKGDPHRDEEQGPGDEQHGPQGPRKSA